MVCAWDGDDDKLIGTSDFDDESNWEIVEIEADPHTQHTHSFIPHTLSLRCIIRPYTNALFS